MNSLKKLLYIANLRLPTEKAYGIQIAKMCEAFADNGVKVSLIFPFRKNPHIKSNMYSFYSVKQNFEAKRVWSPDFYFPGWLDKIAANTKGIISALSLSFYAIKHKADIIYSRDEWPLYFLSFFKNNLVFEAHRFSKHRLLFYKRFKNINLKIVVITQHLKDDFIKIGFRPENILVASDGVDLNEFKGPNTEEQRNEERIKARENLFTDHFDFYRRKKIAVYMGSLYAWKGASVNFITSVAEHLKQHNPNFLLWIIGGAGSAYKDIEILKKGLHPNIIPFYGWVPHKEVANILRAADCAILTGSESEVISKKYTSPLKMFEYMALGCLIVAQDLPSFREVLSDKNNAVFAKAGDAKDLADKIAWVFDDNNKERVEKIATKALKDVQNYTWQNRAKNILGFIK